MIFIARFNQQISVANTASQAAEVSGLRRSLEQAEGELGGLKKQLEDNQGMQKPYSFSTNE